MPCLISYRMSRKMIELRQSASEACTASIHFLGWYNELGWYYPGSFDVAFYPPDGEGLRKIMRILQFER